MDNERRKRFNIACKIMSEARDGDGTLSTEQVLVQVLADLRIFAWEVAANFDYLCELSEAHAESYRGPMEES